MTKESEQLNQLVKIAELRMTSAEAELATAEKDRDLIQTRMMAAYQDILAFDDAYPARREALSEEFAGTEMAGTYLGDLRLAVNALKAERVRLENVFAAANVAYKSAEEAVEEARGKLRRLAASKHKRQELSDEIQQIEAKAEESRTELDS